MQVAEPLSLGAHEPAGNAADYEMTAGASSSSWAAEEPATMELELQDADGQDASAMELEADTMEPELGATSDEVEMGEAEPETAEPADEEIVDYAEDDVPQASLDPGDEELAAASSPAPFEAEHPASEHADVASAPHTTVSENAESAADRAPQPEEHIEPLAQPAEQPAESAAPVLEAGPPTDVSEPSAPGASIAVQQDEPVLAAETASARDELEEEQHQEDADGSAAQDDSAAHEHTAEAAEPSLDADETASEAAEAEEDDDGTIDDQPPSIRLTFAGQDFVLFAADDCSEYLAASQSADAPETSPATVAVAAPRLAAPTEAFHEGLDGLFEALRVRDSLGDFLEERTELVLNLPELELTVREDDVYAREVTLADLHRLHVGGGLQGSLHLVVSEAPRFISRYNLLAAEISVEDGDDTTASAEESGEALHEGADEHDAAEDEQEQEEQQHAEASLGEQQQDDGDEAGDAEHAVEPTLTASHTEPGGADDGATDAAGRADESSTLDAQAAAPDAAESAAGEHEAEAHDDAGEQAADEAEGALEEYVEEDELEAQEDAEDEKAQPEDGTEAEAEGASPDDGDAVAESETVESADHTGEEQIVDYEEAAGEAAPLEEPSALASGDNVQYEEDAAEHASGKRPFAEPDDEEDEASAKRVKVD